jgi:uncharacterized membrane protein YfcA
MEIAPALFAAVCVAALFCQYADASIGMGYGTTLTPFLIIIGFAPLEVVPAVLLGQLVGGIAAGLAHHRLGNISLDFKRDEQLIKQFIKGRMHRLIYLPKSTDSKVIFILAVCGIVGALVGVFTAINISEIALQTYIGAVVLAVGVLILIRRNRIVPFSWRSFVGVGLLASFNKGISGGGYGPLVTGGQIISGREARNSVGSTTVAEVLVCIVGLIGYLVADGYFSWEVAAAVSIGSVIAALPAALTVRRISSQKLKLLIGAATLILGSYTLAKTYIM